MGISSSLATVGPPMEAQPISAVAITITVSPGHAFVSRRRAASATPASGMTAVASSISRSARRSSAGAGCVLPARADESASSVPATKRSERTARGGRLSMLSYHTSSLQGAARAVENPDIVASIMAKPRRGDVLDLTIDDLAFGGEGVGRVQGYVLFVRGAVPGDRVRAKVIEARSRFGRAVIESVDTPSPDRVEAPCAYLGRCGGCRLQHLSYTAQLGFPDKHVPDCLERIGGLGEF